MNHNHHTLDGLRELHYPAALRVDGLAETLIDDEGNLYVYPYIHHSFEATNRLGEVDLTDAQVATDPESGLETVKYPVESDIISFASVLNALEGSKRTKETDITPSLLKIGEFLDAIHERTGLAPKRLSIADLAINRSNGQVELIAPYDLVESPDEINDIGKLQLLTRLFEEILEQSTTIEFMQSFGKSVDEVMEKIGLKHGPQES